MMFLPSGIGPIKSSEHGHPPQSKIRAAIIDANLGVHPQEHVGLVVVADAKFAVGGARDNAVCVFRHALTLV